MGRKGKKSVALTLAIALGTLVNAAPSVAQDGSALFDVPAGCTAFLTTQARSCMVSHSWTCEGDPAGSHWRVSLDQDGAFYLSFTDAEFRWLQTWDLRRNSTSTLVEPEEDPASVTELLATGSDSMVFSTISEGPMGRERRDYTGFDRLTGATVMVDGRSLEVTEFTYQYETGGGVRQVEGNQFFHRDWRMFFGGIETITTPSGENFEANYSPMAFAEPGDTGFLTTQPIYDCGDMMSALETPLWRAAR